MSTFNSQDLFRYLETNKKSTNRGLFSLDILDQVQQQLQCKNQQVKSPQSLSQVIVNQSKKQHKQQIKDQHKNSNSPNFQQKKLQSSLKISKTNNYIKVKQVNIISSTQKIRKRITSTYKNKKNKENYDHKKKNTTEFSSEKNQPKKSTFKSQQQKIDKKTAKQIQQLSVAKKQNQSAKFQKEQENIQSKIWAFQLKQSIGELQNYNKSKIQQQEELKLQNHQLQNQNKQQQNDCFDRNQSSNFIRNTISMPLYYFQNQKMNESKIQEGTLNSRILKTKFMKVTINQNNKNNFNRTQIRLGKKIKSTVCQSDYYIKKDVSSAVTKKGQISLKSSRIKFNKKQNHSNSKIHSMKKSQCKIKMTINEQHQTNQQQKSRLLNFSSSRKSSKGINILSKSVSCQQNKSISKFCLSSTKDKKIQVTKAQVPIRQIKQFSNSSILNPSQKPNLSSNLLSQCQKECKNELNSIFAQNSQDLKGQIKANKPRNVNINNASQDYCKQNDSTVFQKIDNIQKFSNQKIKKSKNLQPKVNQNCQKLSTNQGKTRKNVNPILFYQSKRINKKIQ